MIFWYKKIFFIPFDERINRSLGSLSTRGLKSVSRPLGIGVKTNPKRPDTL
jgi:hypothetical protein